MFRRYFFLAGAFFFLVAGFFGIFAPDARAFDKAVACLFANKGARVYGYDKPPSPANHAAFQQFLSRAAISEARR